MPLQQYTDVSSLFCDRGRDHSIYQIGKNEKSDTLQIDTSNTWQKEWIENKTAELA